MSTIDAIAAVVDEKRSTVLIEEWATPEADEGMEIHVRELPGYALADLIDLSAKAKAAKENDDEAEVVRIGRQIVLLCCFQGMLDGETGQPMIHTDEHKMIIASKSESALSLISDEVLRLSGYLETESEADEREKKSSDSMS